MISKTIFDLYQKLFQNVNELLEKYIVKMVYYMMKEDNSKKNNELKYMVY